MGLFSRLFGKHRRGTEALAADRARQQSVRGRAVIQTADEQQATRQRMEADLDTQRERRSAPKA